MSSAELAAAVPAAEPAADAMDVDSKGEQKESLRELRERAMAQYETIGEEKQRMQRLNFLLEKSAAYVSFVAKRLETKRAEKRQGRAAPAGGSAAAAGAGKKKRKRGAAAAEEDAAEAAEARPEEDGDDEQRTINGEAVSARQPRSITGGVMREYQLEGMEWLASL
ncbi:hypothetical protein IWQ57_002374, partial [Coemansia nantahalensis]